MPKESSESVEARVGARIAQLRESNGWTQEVLGKKLRVTWQRVSRIEGGVNMTLSSVVTIAGVFGLTVQEFFEGLPAIGKVKERKPGRPPSRS